MNDYLQPDFYRFSDDSLDLVRFVQSNIVSCRKLADLGAGSGVMGLELARFYRPELVVLLELQEAFEPYLKKNVAHFYPDAEIVSGSFSSWNSTEKFDLIVCNPPYYDPKSFRKSPHEQRAISRTFIKDGWDELLKCITRHLSSNGSAFLVIKKELVPKIETPGLIMSVTFTEKLALIRLDVDRNHR